LLQCRLRRKGRNCLRLEGEHATSVWAAATHSVSSSAIRAIVRPSGDQAGSPSLPVSGVATPVFALTTTKPLPPAASHARWLESGDQDCAVDAAHPRSGRDSLPSAFITAAPPGREKAIKLPSGDGSGSPVSSLLVVNWVKPVPSGLTA
jgi:hypothetical protein